MLPCFELGECLQLLHIEMYSPWRDAFAIAWEKCALGPSICMREWTWRGFQDTFWRNLKPVCIKSFIWSYDASRLWKNRSLGQCNFEKSRPCLHPHCARSHDIDPFRVQVPVHHLILHFTHFEFPANIILWMEKKRFRHYAIILPWSLIMVEKWGPGG